MNSDKPLISPEMTPTVSISRTTLTRTHIVEEAISFVDEHGLQALTMRHLGQRLGVEAMSLYHHINGREDLLEAMIGHVVDQARVPPETAMAPRDGWQGYLQRLATSVRQIALDHPNLFPLVATRPPSASWLRPPLRSLLMVEDFLTAMLRRGVSEANAVLIYKSFTGLLLGHLLLEASVRGASMLAIDEPLNEGQAQTVTPDATLDLQHYPNLHRLSQQLSQYDPEVEFQQALEMLLDRLDHEISQ